jgi:hypothetical protein
MLEPGRLATVFIAASGATVSLVAESVLQLLNISCHFGVECITSTLGNSCTHSKTSTLTLPLIVVAFAD